MPATTPCPHCGLLHPGLCPRIRSYATDGRQQEDGTPRMLSVEYHGWEELCRAGVLPRPACEGPPVLSPLNRANRICHGLGDGDLQLLASWIAQQLECRETQRKLREAKEAGQPIPAPRRSDPANRRGKRAAIRDLRCLLQRVLGAVRLLPGVLEEDDPAEPMLYVLARRDLRAVFWEADRLLDRTQELGEAVTWP